MNPGIIVAILSALLAGACSSKRPDDRVTLAYRLDFEAAADRDPATDRRTLVAGAVASTRTRLDERGLSEVRVLPRNEGFVVELRGIDEESLAHVKELIVRQATLALVVDGAPLLTGSAIELAKMGYDPVRDAPNLEVTFTAKGAQALEALAARSPNAALVVTLDGKHHGTLQLPARVEGRRWSFTVAGADENAQLHAAADLATVLQVGAVTTPLRLVP